MRWIGMLVCLAAGCEGEFGEGGEGGEGGGDWGGVDTAGGGGGDGSCNTDNEACRAGTCGGEGANMLPGADCLNCHSGGGGGEDEAGRWSAAGTVFDDLLGSSGAGGATVRITDSTGYTASMTTSSKGNFYTSHTLVPPLTAEVETAAGTRVMGQEVSTGACNSCHQCDGAAGGKLYAP